MDKTQFLTHAYHPRVKRVSSKTDPVNFRISEQIIDPEFESLGTQSLVQIFILTNANADKPRMREPLFSVTVHPAQWLIFIFFQADNRLLAWQ